MIHNVPFKEPVQRLYLLPGTETPKLNESKVEVMNENLFFPGLVIDGLWAGILHSLHSFKT